MRSVLETQMIHQNEALGLLYLSKESADENTQVFGDSKKNTADGPF